MERVYNFSAGPAAIPTEVLEKARDELLNINGSGMSIMEHSHRGADYETVHTEAKELVRKLLHLPDGYEVLFIQGGASLQFCMAPMNFLTHDRSADYVLTGRWSVLAHAQGLLFGSANILASSKETRFDRIPDFDASAVDPKAEYVHITSNNTIAGTQYRTFPDTGGIPLIADMSSDIMSRPFDVAPFGMIYAGAQKNLGPAGLTLVVLRAELLDRANANLPPMLSYKTYVDHDSRYNTPPTFAIYMLRNTLAWIDGLGGLGAMEKRNVSKAEMLYRSIDESGGFYKAHARPGSRSAMNVAFRLGDEELEKRFISQAADAGLKNLKGHRSVGGVRASIYNALGLDAVRALVDFMQQFMAKNG